MSEASSVFKVLVFLGFIMLMVGLMYPGANSSWTNLQATLNTGLNLPEFVNPFAPTYYYMKVFPDAASPIANSTDYVRVHGCTDAQWYDCISTNDGNTSYIVLGPGGQFFSANLTDTLSGGEVVSVSMTIWCYALNVTSPTITVHWDAKFVDYPDACPLAGNFTSMTNDIPAPWTGDPYNDVNNTAGMYIESVPTGEVRITYLEVMVGVTEIVTCSGNIFENMGCQLARFFHVIALAFQFIINAAAFLITSFATVIVFVFNIITGFLGGIIGTLMFFMALPGAPPVIQYLLDALFIAMIGWVVYVVFKSIRGTSTI